MKDAKGGAEPSVPAKASPSSAEPALPIDVDDVGTCSREATSQTPRSARAEVKLHVYHCDQYTGFLNKVWLKQQEIGIYHAGVEVYGEEWSFQYFEDTWEDPSVSGVIHCRPCSMGEYDFQETVSLGCTPLSEDEADRVIWRLYTEWPACSYHLTRHNCITFADTLVSELRTPKPFPAWLKGIVDASNNRQTVDAIVDYSWSWMKWWMLRKHQHPRREEEEAEFLQWRNGASRGPDTPRAGCTPQCGAIWTMFQSPIAACSANSLCPGNRNTDQVQGFRTSQQISLSSVKSSDYTPHEGSDDPVERRHGTVGDELIPGTTTARAGKVPVFSPAGLFKS